MSIFCLKCNASTCLTSIFSLYPLALILFSFQSMSFFVFYVTLFHLVFHFPQFACSPSFFLSFLTSFTSLFFYCFLFYLLFWLFFVSLFQLFILSLLTNILLLYCIHNFVSNFLFLTNFFIALEDYFYFLYTLYTIFFCIFLLFF